jgi:hypothetical protein
MAVSAGAAASGAACTSVGDRSMRNYLKFGGVPLCKLLLVERVMNEHRGRSSSRE